MQKNSPNAKQQNASNPKHSIWVSASAGTGKTKVLIDRLLRLLLTGTPISQILCLTFTKAAAQEMINRLISILGKWSTFNEIELQQAINELQGSEATPEEILLAQELFNTILDHPEQLAIQTIHSFCQQILAKFPIEAKVPTNFTIIEDSFATELKQQAIELALNKIHNEPSEQNTINTLTNQLGLFNFENNVNSILDLSEKMALITNTYNLNNSWDKFDQSLYAYFNFDKQQNSEKILAEFFNHFPQQTLKTIHNYYLQNNVNHKALSLENMDKLLNHNSKDLECFKLWYNFFYTKTHTPKKKIFNKTITDALNKRINLEDFLPQELLRIAQANESLKILNYMQLNKAFMKVSTLIYNTYQQLKAETCLLDYNDIIIKTYNLFKITNINAWVMFKLDQGIEHILVDEAQDTNPIQWEIIKFLSNEFFSGATAKENNRTVFVVGDIKQSIYNFQGADTSFFQNTKQHFYNIAKNANQPFTEVAMLTSFRSASGIIKFINEVTKNMFEHSPLYLGEQLEHIPYHQAKAYNIEVWPIIKSKPDENKHIRYENLAIAISKKVALLHREFNIPFNDMLLLYRKRANNLTLDYLVKKLKDSNIPILGLDKLQLNEHIVVQDLIAIATFLCQVNDDFSLACILKSPLFNLDDNDIFQLTQHKINHKKQNLFSSLYSINQEPFLSIYQQLQSWSNKLDYISVFDLYFHILYVENKIINIIQRLGIEAFDPISEFMNLVINFQSTNADNLQNFLYFMNKHQQEIKRDSSDKDSIRLMTIHGSKGLQAKVIFLLIDIESKDQSDKLLFNNDLNQPLLFLSQNAKERPEKIKQLLDYKKKQQQEESERLLYVALTRAEEQLYICVSGNEETKASSKSNYLWHKILTQSAENVLEKKSNNFFNQDLNFVSSNFYGLANLNTTTKIASSNTKVKIPQWALESAPIEPTPTLPLTPSQLYFEDNSFISPLEHQPSSSHSILNQGIILHQILEQINHIQNNHEVFISKWLDLYNIDKSVATAIKNNILTLINHPKLNYIFKTKALNEVSISGQIIYHNQLQVVSARIDKLIITDTEITIVDYKLASKKAVIPSVYITQIDLYKKLLQQIYPQHNIRGFILFTQNPVLIEI